MEVQRTIKQTHCEGLYICTPKLPPVPIMRPISVYMTRATQIAISSSRHPPRGLRRASITGDKACVCNASRVPRVDMWPVLRFSSASSAARSKMPPVTLISSLPPYISPEEHAQITGSTPASFSDIPSVLRHKEENVSAILTPPVEGFSAEDGAQGTLYIIDR